MKTSDTILIPSFLRRVLKAYALKQQIRALGCVLNRKGRSRHWLLTASQQQLRQIIEMIQTSEEPSWQWLATMLASHLAGWSEAELQELVRKKPSITVNELVAKTDCTIAVARKVIDQVEWENN